MRNAVAFADTKCYTECDTNSYSAASNTEAAPDSAPAADASLTVKRLKELKS